MFWKVTSITLQFSQTNQFPRTWNNTFFFFFISLMAYKGFWLLNLSMQDIFYFWHPFCYVYRSCFSHVFISMSCQNKIVIRSYHIRDRMFYTNWQIRCTLITRNTWHLPPNLESTQKCHLWIGDRWQNGQFFFSEGWMPGLWWTDVLNPLSKRP